MIMLWLVKVKHFGLALSSRLIFLLRLLTEVSNIRRLEEFVFVHQRLHRCCCLGAGKAQCPSVLPLTLYYQVVRCIFSRSCYYSRVTLVLVMLAKKAKQSSSQFDD